MVNTHNKKYLNFAKLFIIVLLLPVGGSFSVYADETGEYLIENVFFADSIFLPPTLKSLQTPTLQFNFRCWGLFAATNHRFPDDTEISTIATPSSSTIESFFSAKVIEELTSRGVDMLDTGNMEKLREIKHDWTLTNSTSFEWLDANPYPEANLIVKAFAPVEVIFTLSQLSDCERFALEQLHP